MSVKSFYLPSGRFLTGEQLLDAVRAVAKGFYRSEDGVHIGQPAFSAGQGGSRVEEHVIVSVGSDFTRLLIVEAEQIAAFSVRTFEWKGGFTTLGNKSASHSTAAFDKFCKALLDEVARVLGTTVDAIESYSVTMRGSIPSSMETCPYCASRVSTTAATCTRCGAPLGKVLPE